MNDIPQSDRLTESLPPSVVGGGGGTSLLDPPSSPSVLECWSGPHLRCHLLGKSASKKPNPPPLLPPSAEAGPKRLRKPGWFVDGEGGHGILGFSSSDGFCCLDLDVPLSLSLPLPFCSKSRSLASISLMVRLRFQPYLDLRYSYGSGSLLEESRLRCT